MNNYRHSPLKQLLPCLMVMFFSAVTVTSAQPSPKIAFTISEADLIPEGIAWDGAKNHFYISSIAKKKIIRIDEDKNITDFITSGRDDLGEVLGMKVNPRTNTLWACNNKTGTSGHAALHVFDLGTGALVKKYVLMNDTQQHGFNDLCIMSNDDVYITDTEGSGIFRIRKDSDSLESFIAGGGIPLPNGIAVSGDPNLLYVATSTARGIVTVNLQTREVKRLPAENLYSGVLDGLYYTDHMLIGIQNVFFPETITAYRLTEKGDSILSMQVLAYDQPQFSIPTTGVIAGDWFYFIANSNVDLYENGVIRNRGRLGNIYIMKLKWRK